MLLQMLHQAESRKRRDPWSNRPRSRDMGSRKIPAERVSGHRGLGTRAAGFDGVPIRLRCDARRASRGPACSQRWRSAPKIVGSRGGALARALAVRQAPACPACCPPSKPLARLGPKVLLRARLCATALPRPPTSSLRVPYISIPGRTGSCPRGIRMRAVNGRLDTSGQCNTTSCSSRVSPSERGSRRDASGVHACCELRAACCNNM